jgi:hypothetical protein
MPDRTRKPSPTEYQDKYFEEKFKNVNEKLDEICDKLDTKASCRFVDTVEARLKIVEDNHVACPMHLIVPDVNQLKTDRDILMEVTEDIRFYKKKPNQFKLLVVGFLVLVLLNLISVIPGLLAVKERTSIQSTVTEIKKEQEQVKEALKNFNKEDK